MNVKMIGRKKGMTHVFDDKGRVVPCTLIQLKPHVVSQVKTLETDGYTAIQLGTEKLKAARKRKYSRPILGHFEKHKIEPRKHILESRLEDVDAYSLNQEIDLSIFSDIKSIDVTAISKGKGYQGVVKRHGFKGFGPSHGEGPIHRHGGSTGQRSCIGRTWKGRKMAGHMGAKRVTIQNLEIVKIDLDNEVIFVKGAVPGANESIVEITKSVKGKRS